MTAETVVITGAGGMGSAVARRIGSGRRIVLADAAPEHLDRAVAALEAEGHDVSGRVVDVGDQESVLALAAYAAAEGRLAAVVHTAGVSAATASIPQILRVDLAGTAYLIDAFAAVAVPGTAVVCVASMAGHYARLSAAEERALASEPASALLTLDVVRSAGPDAVSAYILAKRANQVRASAAALAYSRRGARINTLSPGVISTPMARAEQQSASGDHMMAMLEACGAGRTGTPAEVAEAVAFLAGPDARYITGTDLLLDGGQAAWIRWHRPS
ncbi:short-chain dehydrogenase/reductas [Actinoplanes sp. OR16]|uniref:SDR family oxidoreductase n=1 Tax=Actinoplanes sp. OR16 TaxID=946334 RepID=UPI000F700416|nr:SDR family oxidoreductase [Actinoplanes sp. OR16]BBH69320.1 short-chain dehydrogenase/reductas [Actinoplanes sp. OR16]